MTKGEPMNLAWRSYFYWPIVLAVGFFLIPILLAYIYPYSFWTSTDYEPLGLADALNMAYRLADLRMYPATGISYHPGVPFYFLGWLALAATGRPIASGPDFFRTVLDHVEQYHFAIGVLGALVGAAGVYIFARAASRIVPVAVVVIAILLWITSTPATLQMFSSTSIDSFALIINAMFLAVVIPLAREEEVDPNILVLAGFVGALAYLNKLSYVYIPVALYAAAFTKFVLSGVSWPRHFRLMTVYFATLLLVVYAAGFLVIGREGLHDLYQYQKGVFWGTGLYGEGEQTVVSGSAVWRALDAIPRDRAYAVPIALIGGVLLGLGGLVTGWLRPAHRPAAVISVATGGAAALSALIVLKHYDLHYTAGVSATLPAWMVGVYLLVRAWAPPLRFVAMAAAAVAIPVMALKVAPYLDDMFAFKVLLTQQAEADRDDIRRYLAENTRGTEFVYRAPFVEYGEGFVVIYGSVPRMTYEYFKGRSQVVASPVAAWVSRDIGVYVLDKQYFRTVESIKTAPNIALLDANPAKYRDGDKIVELRSVFLLIRG
jgi:hypothetical protein